MLSIINKSIFRKLMIYYLFTVLLGLGVVGIAISYMVKDYIYTNTQEELIRKGRIVNSTLQNINIQSEQGDHALQFLDQTFNARIWIFNHSGEIISTSTRDEVSIGKSVAPWIVEQVMQGENTVSRLRFEGLQEPMISVVVPWGKENVVIGGIVLHAPVVGVNNTVMRIRETILWATLLGVLVSAGLILYLAWSISKPLRDIERLAAKIGLGNYSERIEIESEDEIGDLAQTINSMAEKLNKIDIERKKLDQMRNDFLANVSHELRSPLTAMQGFLEALQDGLIPDENSRKHYYQIMYRETMHMSRLVEDIFDLIKLENREISLRRESIKIGQLLNKISFKFKHKLEQRQIGLELGDIPDDLVIVADPDRLEQILVNLIKNAIAHTEQGTISLAASIQEKYVVLSVKDTGVGIPEDDQELIWERFFKVDRGRARRNKGTGLGLAIVKELVELHQGRIELESILGKGTEVKIYFPR